MPEDSQEFMLRTPPIGVKWEVPLYWLVGVLGIIVGQAVVMYFTQIRQGELLTAQSETQREVLKRVADLNTMMTTNNVKDVEHDMKIADHERRVQAIEFRVVQAAIELQKRK